jgi:hypothetical protein
MGAKHYYFSHFEKELYFAPIQTNSDGASILQSRVFLFSKVSFIFTKILQFYKNYDTILQYTYQGTATYHPKIMLTLSTPLPANTKRNMMKTGTVLLKKISVDGWG